MENYKRIIEDQITSINGNEFLIIIKRKKLWNKIRLLKKQHLLKT